jgi:PhnB protein
MKNKNHTTHFTPQLMIKVLLPAMEFYKKAFGATELRRFSNPDGSVHVAEMEIDGAMFHLHEESEKSKQLSPETLKASTTLVGIFVDDPYQMVRDAEVAGGRVTNPVQDYEYGYRQGTVMDPFGHQWLIQKKI